MKNKTKYFLISLLVALVLTSAGCSMTPLGETARNLATEPPVWVLQQIIPAYEGSTNAAFGRAVAVSESAAADYIIIGDEDCYSYSGRAYIYKLNRTLSVNPWEHQKTLVPTSSGGSFGFSLDIMENQAVVGAYYDSSAGSNRGAIYIYEYETGDWNEKNKFTGYADEDQLGFSVAITTNMVIAGAPYNDIGHPEAGRVEIFLKPGSSWNSSTPLYANDGINESNSSFGKAIDIFEDKIIVGAPDFDITTNHNEGKVYLFLNTGSWTKQAITQPSPLSINNYFGQAVSIYGDSAFAGAGTANSFAEAYYNNTGSWTNEQLTAAGIGFGTSVAVADSYAAVGAPLENGSQGTVYIYRRSGSTWAIYGEPLLDSTVLNGDLFGCAVALSGRYCVIGAKAHGSSGEGAVYVFKLQ